MSGGKAVVRQLTIACGKARLFRLRRCLKVSLVAVLACSAGPGALSTAARQCWLDFSAWLEPQLSEHGALAHIADWAGKLAGAAARIAGLLHAADLAGERDRWWNIPITVETMERVRQYQDLSMGWCVNCHREKAQTSVAGKSMNAMPFSQATCKAAGGR